MTAILSRRAFARRILGIALALTGVLAWRAARAATFAASDRRCATCNFWQGKRRLSPDGKRVIVPDDERGICMNGQSPQFGKVTFPGQVFPEGYRKWRSILNFAG